MRKDATDQSFALSLYTKSRGAKLVSYSCISRKSALL